jgi:glyoxylase-like metal-dependent hydrolase (beta-lactamase superfamily II)
MIFEQIPISGDRNFAYLIADEETRGAALADPGSDARELIERIRSGGLHLVYVLLTHGHHDHTGAAGEVSRATGARIVRCDVPRAEGPRAGLEASPPRLRGPRDEPGGGEIRVRDGDTLLLGSLEIRVLHTPGHTPESVCYLVGGKLVTGDTLFVGKIGGTSTEEAARQEYDSLHRKICALPPETEIWPGHDYGVRPSSTVGEEIRTNPFLLRRSFEEFLDLKIHWAEYKRTHGIA